VDTLFRHIVLLIGISICFTLNSIIHLLRSHPILFPTYGPVISLYVNDAAQHDIWDIDATDTLATNLHQRQGR